QARRGAGRILAVHAHLPHEAVAVIFYNRERGGRELVLGVAGKSVNLFAGLLSTPAADALRDVDQNSSGACHGSSPLPARVPLGQQELFHHFFLQFRVKPRKHTTDGQSAVLRQSWRGFGYQRVQPGYVVLHSGRDHRALNQVPLIHGQVGRLHGGQPAVLVRIIRDQAGIPERVVVDCRDYALHGREQIDAGVAAVQRDQLLSLTYPAIGSANIDVIDLAQQVGDELVDADSRVVGAFFHNPHVSEM